MRLLERPSRPLRGALRHEVVASSNGSEMAPQAVEIAQNGLGNGEPSVASVGKEDRSGECRIITPAPKVLFSLGARSFHFAGSRTSRRSNASLGRFRPQVGLSPPRKTADRISYRCPSRRTPVFSNPSPQRWRPSERSPDFPLGHRCLWGEGQSQKVAQKRR